MITEVMDHKKFLPAAFKGGWSTGKKNDDLQKYLNHQSYTTQTECIAERNVLKKINANCNVLFRFMLRYK